MKQSKSWFSKPVAAALAAVLLLTADGGALAEEPAAGAAADAPKADAPAAATPAASEAPAAAAPAPAADAPAAEAPAPDAAAAGDGAGDGAVDTPPANGETTEFAIAAGVAMRDACKLRNPDKAKQFDDGFAKIVNDIPGASEIMAKPDFASFVKKIADDIAAHPVDDKEIAEQCAGLTEAVQ